MTKPGRRMAAQAQVQFARAKSSFGKLKKKLHRGQDDKPSSDRSGRKIFQLSVLSDKPEPQGDKSAFAASSAGGDLPPVFDSTDSVVVNYADDGLEGLQKLPIMVMKQLEQMREECTVSGDDDKPRQTLSSLLQFQRWLAFSITYSLCSILPLQEKDLPTVQKLVANNIHQLAPVKLSSQAPPYQYICSPSEGNAFCLADGGNGCGGCDGPPIGCDGGSGSNQPEDDDKSGRGKDCEGGGGGGGQDKGKGKDAETNDRLYVCPFFRHDPVRYQRCLKYKLRRFGDVKQHINREHVLGTYYCPKCLQQWKDDCEEFRAHLRSACNMSPVHEYLDDKERENLNGKKWRSKRSGIDNWMDIWQQFFAGHPEPVSPYLETPFEEITQDCRERNSAEAKARLQQLFGPRIATGQQPTPQEWDGLVAQLLDVCLDTSPVEPRRFRNCNRTYANSTGSTPAQARGSRPRNLSDPGPSSGIVPCENQYPATAPLIYPDASSQYLSVPSQQFFSSHNSSSNQISTPELMDPRNDPFSGGPIAHDSIFNTADEPQSQFSGPDPSLFSEYVSAMAPSWAGQAQGGLNDLGGVADHISLGFDSSSSLPYTQPQIHPPPALEASEGMVEPLGIQYAGAGSMPHPNLPSSSSPAGRMQVVQPKRKASIADLRQAKRGSTPQF